MLQTYRRHRETCEHKEDRKYARCRCPIWLSGSLRGQQVRQSLKEDNWERAQRRLREWETTATKPKEEIRHSIEKATADYIADAQARKLKDSTIDRHRIIFRQLSRFAAAEGYQNIDELDTRALAKFRATWRGSSGLAASKKLERLRGFFKFTLEQGLTAGNPASAIRRPKVRANPTLPYSEAEMARILAAADEKIAQAGEQGRNRWRRARALIIFLRYTGLRISDAVGCRADRLRDGKLFLYTAKTGQHVFVPLPPFVVAELERVPRLSAERWFWSGTGKLETHRKKWGDALAQIFGLAAIAGGHAHRFRDTFAVELLVAGTPIERVAIFLGHSSVRITEKHYNPWNRARQEQAELDVQASWAKDPLLLLNEDSGGRAN